MLPLRVPAGPGRLVLDVLLVAWTLAWIAVGSVVASEVRGLASLSDTVGEVGVAAQRTGDAIAGLSGLPLLGDAVGGRVQDAARAVRAAGEDAVASAASSRSSARTVGTLLGVCIALIPTLPVLLLYVPGRVSAERERRAIKRAVAERYDRGLEELLALRAVVHLPYQRLREVSRDPGEDLAAGRHAALAEAELARLGLRRPA
jgi:hypothetical protein